MLSQINESNIEQRTTQFVADWFPTPGGDVILDGPDEATIDGLWKQFCYENEEALKEYEKWWKYRVRKLWSEKICEMIQDRLSDEELSVTVPDRPYCYTYVARETDNGYSLSSHQDSLPAFMTKHYASVVELITAMRKVAPLSRWAGFEDEETSSETDEKTPWRNIELTDLNPNCPTIISIDHEPGIWIKALNEFYCRGSINDWYFRGAETSESPEEYGPKPQEIDWTDYNYAELLGHHSWDVIVAFMDDEIREEIACKLSYDREVDFLIEYQKWHEAKYGELLKIN